MDATEKLKALAAGGMSQADMARAIGVTQPTISRLLRGLQDDMRASTAARIDAVWSAWITRTAA